MSKRALVTLCLLTLTLLGWAETGLSAPSGLVVEREGAMYKGRWDAVPGASYYEVWVKNYGRWVFDAKALETSPFTSSFELRVEDERARFRVRAVDSQGVAGDYSGETGSTKVAESAAPDRSTAISSSSAGGFDPKAPPPPPPTGLFAIWTETDIIKLVWYDARGAKNYAVEELIDGVWVSPARIEFPRANTALIKDHPSPGPYRFRVRSVGSNGRASEPSRPTTAQR
ncbi:MAG: hypothetical protein WC314_16410 [Vulcanimicrobiota bacterium]